MATTAAILLSAGESTRMGETKALLPWRDITLLEHQVGALTSAGLSPIVVVLGHQSDKLESLLGDRAGVECVYNPGYIHGKATSVKAGVGALRRLHGTSADALAMAAILVLGVDQPRSGDTIRRVVDLHGDGAWLITVPTYQGKGGHPVIFSSSLINEMLEVSEDTLGLKSLVRRHEARTQRVETASPEVLLDLNTPDDYRRALDTLA